MNAFVEKLRNDHQVLFRKLEAFRTGDGITGKSWKEDLFAARTFFEDHLREEDRKLYPVLLKYSEKDPVLKKITERFISEMRRITEQTLAFFRKHGETSSGTEFMQDYSELLVRLKSRMDEEERILFKEFERIETEPGR